MSVGTVRLREEADVIRNGCIAKGEDPALVDEALVLDAQRRELLAKADAMRAQKKQISDNIGIAIQGGEAPNGARVSQLKEQSNWIGAEISGMDARLTEVFERLQDVLLRIPNPPDPDVPVGGEEASEVVRTWGEPVTPHEEPQTDEQVAWVRKPHWEVAEALGMIDLPAGAKITGSGWPLYKGAGSKLQRTLIDYFLDLHTTENGMTEVWPPVVVNEESARGTGQIPDKEDQMYVVTRDELYLAPTAEVPVTNIHRDEIIEAEDLPIRYAAYSPCFRREAGAAGAKTRGILRVHQFDKVEMVAFVRPEESNDALEWMTSRAEDILQRLGLSYRVKLMASGDMGFTQAKKYDLEVWAPGVEDWLEVSSVSNFRDYQARRMQIRYRPEKGAKPEILHTLNGSGLALARVVAAILEVYQQPDGSVIVPEALRDRLGERITAD
ncbi:MAG: serine--tRNA ligase [Candidatus Limnocylindrales bacterium]